MQEHKGAGKLSPKVGRDVREQEHHRDKAREVTACVCGHHHQHIGMYSEGSDHMNLVIWLQLQSAQYSFYVKTDFREAWVR